jgi:CDP-glycerol glycerophosphotransferase (TagB/SpsB family)
MGGSGTKKALKKIKNIFVYLYYLAYYYVACVIGIAARHTKKYKDLWLIAERKTEARDNGFHFFKYMTENHGEINAAFIIEKNSPDYERINRLGRVIEPNSFSHMLAFVCARVRISTHYMSCAPDTYRFAVLKKYGLVFGRDVLIRHGITSNDLKELHYPNARVDMLVCSSVPEYENMKTTYGHPNGVVQRLGLCRYDRLLTPHRVKRQILIMPTWRYFLKNLSDEDFVKSEYYNQFLRLLNDEKLIAVLEKYDYELVLYLHYELQPYSELFKPMSERVRVLKKDKADVQDLLMSSAMLITDYSSVFFDFAYMSKPLAYLRFDEERFYATQYGRGYFDCRTDGFGPVFYDAAQAAEHIRQKIEYGMCVDDEYARRAERFFGERTANHCEKTYMAIKELLT